MYPLLGPRTPRSALRIPHSVRIFVSRLQTLLPGMCHARPMTATTSRGMPGQKPALAPLPLGARRFCHLPSSILHLPSSAVAPTRWPSARILYVTYKQSQKSADFVCHIQTPFPKPCHAPLVTATNRQGAGRAETGAEAIALQPLVPSPCVPVAENNLDCRGNPDVASGQAAFAHIPSPFAYAPLINAPTAPLPPRTIKDTKRH